MKQKSKSWNQDVKEIIDGLPGKQRRRTFTLADVYSHESKLRRRHPGNNNIQPKVRQILQILCADGFIKRVRPGTYQRLSRRSRQKS